MSTRKRITFLIALMIGTLVATTACGGDSLDPEFAKVNPGSRTYSIDDFQSVGFKVVKEYDVEGLIGAKTAVHGFLKVIGLVPQSYELRFYETHEDAVRLGTALAEEITGEDAVMVAGDMTWTAGKREQRERANDHGGYAPFYWNFAIYGNVVMLCEGDWPEQSLEVCSQLQEVLDGRVHS